MQSMREDIQTGVAESARARLSRHKQTQAVGFFQEESIPVKGTARSGHAHFFGHPLLRHHKNLGDMENETEYLFASTIILVRLLHVRMTQLSKP